MAAMPVLAQQAAKKEPPKPAPSPSQAVLEQWNDIGRKLIIIAEDLPEDKYDFKPNPDSRTFVAQLLHVAASMYYFTDTALGQKPRYPDDPKRDELKTKDQIVKYLKDAFAHAHKAVATINNSNLLEQTTDPFNPKGKRTRVDSVGIFYWHTYDHYGQMVEYLRMNGLVPPASR